MAQDPSPAIRVRGLVKHFDDRAVLDGVDLDVPRGSILGFLGPNGAGKTTTIRSLLGLVRPDAGEMAILGETVPAGLVGLRGRIGAVVDQPAMYPPLTGRGNLAVVADLLGGVPASRIEAVLDLVHLSRDGDRRAETYSYGMRQRLGLAAALLCEPELLILDEPANGLDPAGQMELRGLLHTVRDAGATLLISSHLLAEVQAVCDHVAILARGKVIASGTTQELLAQYATRSAYIVDAGHGNEEAAADALTAAGMVVVATGPLHVEADDPAWITYTLAQAGLWLRRLEPTETSLEQLFLRLTEGKESVS